MNTAFEYMYRDGSNNKSRVAQVIFRGPATDKQVEELTAALDQGQYFIADQVSIPEVFLWNADVGYDPDDPSTYPADLSEGNYCIAEGVDHSWHEFLGLESTEQNATDARSFEQFLGEVRQASTEGWKEFDPSSRKSEQHNE